MALSTFANTFQSTAQMPLCLQTHLLQESDFEILPGVQLDLITGKLDNLENEEQSVNRFFPLALCKMPPSSTVFLGVFREHLTCVHQ